MTDLLLRDGKILIAGNGRGLSAACDCCDDPPPPPFDCDNCCFGTASGDIEIGDSVLVEIEAELPAIRYRFVSPQPGDNGIRRYDSISVSGQVALDVTNVNEFTEKGTKCLGANSFSSWELSDVTISESVVLLITSDALNKLCRIAVSANFQAGTIFSDIQDIADLDEESTLPYAIRTVDTYFRAGWITNINTTVLTSDPCSNQLQFPLIFRAASDSTIYPVVEVIGVEPGEEIEIGKITIVGVG